jgi:malonyl-CoA O-methyltransferase
LLERLEFHRNNPAIILDLGCGTGSASQNLASRFKPQGLVSLDWSPAMLAQAEIRVEPVAGTPHTRWCLCADMHMLPLAANSVDLVFSNLALQWSYDVPVVFSELRRVMKPGAMLVFSCYGPDTLYELRHAWRSVDDRPHVNEFPDMHNIGDELVVAGFAEPVMDVERLTLQYPDVHSLMREIKSIGSHNVASKRSRGLTGKGQMAAMLQAYGKFRHDEIYPASFEVIYGTAFAPEPGQPVRTPEGDMVAFSVDELRSKMATRKRS